MTLLTAIRFGLRLITRDPLRLLRTGAGLSVAVLIVLVEVAFWTSVSDAHLRVVAASRADLFLLDTRRWHLNKWDKIMAVHVNRARGIEGVAAIIPVYQSGMNIRMGRDEAPKRIIAMGFEPSAAPLMVGMTEQATQLLSQPGAVVYDQGSRVAIYGGAEVGQEVFIDDRPMKIVGTAFLGPNLINDGNVIMSDGNFKMLRSDAEPIMALVRLAPGVDPREIQPRIAAALAPEVQVFSREQLNWREANYLGRVAPTGMLFGAGMVAGLIVGAVICYQSFFMTVRRQGKALATLGAMGAAPVVLAMAVITQAVVLSLVGYGIAWALAEGVALWIRETLSVPAALRPEFLLWSALTVILVCVASAWMALRHAAFRHAEQLY